ncbi:hypothetical protein C8F01DRAFT_1068405 [Mycena amicta]|nr:hypothetical protein C8F01DRAFT_1068405 [Mycena amicta]
MVQPVVSWSALSSRVKFAPIHHVPVEIIAEIFMCCLCANGFGALTERCRLPLEPLTLSHVSRRWRSVALSHAALWATIWIDRPRPPHLQMLDMWLERSQQAPLILYLRQTQPTDPKEYDLTEQIITRLARDLHRWYRITFFFALDPQRSLLLLPRNPDAAPLLQHIHLATNDNWERESKLKAEKILHSYRSLNSVVVHPSLTQIHIPWSRLTELDTNQMGSPVTSYLAVLRLCRSLTRAEFRIARDPPTAPFVRPALRLCIPKLSSLTLHLDRTDAAPLLDCLVLPALEGLVLRYTRAYRHNNDPNALRLLLARSGPGCILKRFSLQDNPRMRDPDSSYHLSFLRSPQMAGLVELYMRIDLCGDVLRFLTLGSEEDPAPRNLANLEVLSLADIAGTHLEDLELYRMVVSRLGVKQPLRGAFFHLCLQGHSDSRVLPLLFERCRNRIELKVYLAPCEDRHATSGWYKSQPIPGGYLTDAA